MYRYIYIYIDVYIYIYIYIYVHRVWRLDPHTGHWQVMFFSATIGDDENDPEDRRLRSQLENCLGAAHIICKAERKDVAGVCERERVCVFVCDRERVCEE